MKNRPELRLGWLLCAAATLLLTGCSMGTVTRVYASGGNAISLTDNPGSTSKRHDCGHYDEELYAIELARKAVDTARGAETPAREVPRCESFEIHEMTYFSSGESIDVQAYLREEFGSGYLFDSVTVELTVSVLDWAINVATLGIANSRTVYIRGYKYLAR